MKGREDEGIYIEKKLDFMQTGEFRLFSGVYENKKQIEIHTRQIVHPAKTIVAYNEALAVHGNLLCDHKLEILAESSQLTKQWERLFEDNGGDINDWPNNKSKWLIDGVVKSD